MIPSFQLTVDSLQLTVKTLFTDYCLLFTATGGRVC